MSATRRRFLVTATTATGGLVLAFHLPAAAKPKPYEPYATKGTEVNAWLVIEPDDTVIVRVAQSEMGEGVFTSMPMIVAEELEADWSKVKAEYADVNRHVRESQVYRRFGTGGSSAVRASRPYLQEAGANARERLVRAAAARWGVEPGSCTARASVVTHAASGRSLRYGELAADAAKVSLEGVTVTTKKPDQFTLLGKPVKRLDAPAKVDGSAQFSIDVRMPGMVYAAIRHSPVIGGKYTSAANEAAVKALPGVVAVVPLPNAVAVVADRWWRAKRAVEQLNATFDPGAGAGTSSATWNTDFIAALAKDGPVANEAGDYAGTIAKAKNVVEADYRVPYLAHSCMEPMNCTASIAKGRCDVWVGTQNPESALAAAAEVTGLAPEQCYVHNCFLGGGFGRRSNPDYIRETLAIAKAIGKPVQLIWSREEDTRQGWFRPMAAFRFKAGFDDAGKAVAFYNHSVTHSIFSGLRPDAIKNGIDPTSVEGFDEFVYAVPNRRLVHTIKNTHVTTWFWRSVGASQNAWALESFVDEMAVAAKQDPIELRRSLLAAHPRQLKVLDVLADKAQWGRKLAPGTAQGVALFESFGSIVGQVAEVSVSKAGALKVQRIVSVVDCGHAVNPLTIEAQVESAIVYGLTAALYGKITVENGAVKEGNFDAYPMLKLADTPAMETHLALSRGEEWGGIGEPALPPTAPAVTNAIYRVTGKRIRSLPIAEHDLTYS
jgi:isoquinoline 1-oxidoreductase beta subunit